MFAGNWTEIEKYEEKSARLCGTPQLKAMGKIFQDMDGLFLFLEGSKPLTTGYTY